MIFRFTKYYSNTCVCGFFVFRKFYAKLSDFSIATSVVLFVFCQTALFRIAPILTLVFVVITVHQCISSWMGRVQDLNDSHVNDENDTSSKN